MFDLFHGILTTSGQGYQDFVAFISCIVNRLLLVFTLSFAGRKVLTIVLKIADERKILFS
jgi:hypothetical protein